jgi:hypothetical protein
VPVVCEGVVLLLPVPVVALLVFGCEAVVLVLLLVVVVVLPLVLLPPLVEVGGDDGLVVLTEAVAPPPCLIPYPGRCSIPIPPRLLNS